MPKVIEEHIENYIVSEYKGIVPRHIRKFCGRNRRIVGREVVLNLKAAEAIALRHAKGKNKYHFFFIN